MQYLADTLHMIFTCLAIIFVGKCTNQHASPWYHITFQPVIWTLTSCSIFTVVKMAFWKFQPLLTLHSFRSFSRPFSGGDIYPEISTLTFQTIIPAVSFVFHVCISINVHCLNISWPVANYLIPEPVHSTSITSLHFRYNRFDENTWCKALAASGCGMSDILCYVCKPGRMCDRKG